MTAPEAEGNGNGKVTLALVGQKLDNIAVMVGECKIGLASAMSELHRQDKEIEIVKTELQDFIEFKRSLIKQAAVMVLGSAGLTAVVSYALQNLTK